MVPLFWNKNPTDSPELAFHVVPVTSFSRLVTQALLALADEAQWPSALALLDGDGAVRASPVTFSAVLRACEAEGAGVFWRS